MAAVSRSAGIRRVGDEGNETGVGGVAAWCKVAVCHHLGAESELDLQSTPPPSGSPSLSLEHHQAAVAAAAAAVVAEKRDPCGVPGGEWRSWDMGSQRGRQGLEPLRTPGRGAASGVCSA